MNLGNHMMPSLGNRHLSVSDTCSRGPLLDAHNRVPNRLFCDAVRRDERNTPFQGLAADGAKLALWALVKEGYRCVAFVHDEVLVELPADTDHASEAKRIDEIMCSAMQRVTGRVPIACEYALSERWYKQATAVMEDGKLLPWRP